ncbi:MAG: AraC family transcriptional regulator [Clostridia bacterium]|nr:AraC family transcriptional regulator [Clostridia bacterium]
MEIINEVKFNGIDAIRLFTSSALPRKNNIRIHYHTLIEISLVLRGKGSYKTKNGVYPIKEGDIFFFRPNEAHCITDIESGGMELLNLHVAPYYVYTNLQNATSSNYIKILTMSFPLTSNKINNVLSKEQVEEIINLILKIKQEFEQENSDYLTCVCSYLTALFILFSRAYNGVEFTKSERKNYQKLLQAINYVDTHYKEDLTLDSIVKNVAYSRCYFSSVFKKYMGMSIWDYISIKRIEQALTLIKTTDKNMLEIALECGFNNTVNFNKLFKKYTNVTPNFFRKQ